VTLLTFCRSSHERSHRNADERGAQIRWPWEKIVNGGTDVDDPGTSVSRSDPVDYLLASVDGVAQWLERRSLAGRLSLIYA